ncbi:FliI/YscN family ATPase [Acidocella aminolytica]|jgi:flagellum-specific ATP synthase|uniref:Flagellum-specific ATP synthase n=1 Tax=Acidocella aminolytica 101 = DSM 11237 TaxID=1120923 RepID=A0A0D6PGU4_9PROT|nr:FliI/YscN family ATPase [Acidocella aminolytica]GAN80059.1 secretion system type III flagellum-specific ATPase [Acidocella aminolytica 101 = DSM 11237]GBQ40656.1 flagellum-specific ATP synthase [Acidocella aminolytica 101 = DSM 11237]SHF07654.1 flagellum-specific ATP synthase [Acidocella aminolytica 101 = DSM 11237]
MISLDNIKSKAETHLRAALAEAPVHRYGRVLWANGEKLRVSGLHAPIGARCLVEQEGGEAAAEIIGFEAESLLLMPEQGTRGIMRGARVRVETTEMAVLTGPSLLGRVLDARGKALDGGPVPEATIPWPMLGNPINPMERARIDTPFDVGVTAINALTTFGRGMRVGLFAGSGVGKTTLLGMLARHSRADVVVLAMIGERGREIREFIEDHLGETLSRVVVVASPADDTPLARVHGAYRAAAIAESFRAQGKHVLLLVDSLTRLAMALREIGLAAGEPPASKGYPPSVFGALSAYAERAGNGGPGQGSITAIHTVLVEGDDHVSDPVADTARAILDGHIVLSRAMAEATIYPPIDICASLSRPMPNLVAKEHLHLSQRFRSLWARKQEKRDIIDLGAYAPGRDPILDEALHRQSAMEALLRQDAEVRIGLDEALIRLRSVFGDEP